jgi:NhaP-type Na+/H+ or K+/H+ antiporter
MADSFHATVETILILLLIVFAVAVIARWARLPYTIALVVTGLLGFQPNFRDLQLTPDLILVVFLPGLLFGGGCLPGRHSVRGCDKSAPSTSCVLMRALCRVT